MGPLLFLIYVNDIVNTSEFGKFVLYADDTNIFISGSCEEEVYKKAQVVLDNVYNYMFDNQLHVNVSKSCFMYFRHEYSNEERLVCARTDKPLDKLYSLKLCGQKLKQVSKVKFLGVIIDDNIKWDAHLEYLQTKLKLSIVMIKRIKKFIPENEYFKLYNALFLPHLTYCISAWGAVSRNKLAKLFSLQKRCVRLLFGSELTYDHVEFYMTCARARTYTEHKAKKNFVLEHTKPIFNLNKILSLENLYRYFSFLETFKILKYKSPISIYELLTLTKQPDKLSLNLPCVKLDRSKHSFVFSASKNWNDLYKNVFNRSECNENGIVISGSVINSDLSASTSYIKSKVKKFILTEQKSGCEINW